MPQILIEYNFDLYPSATQQLTTRLRHLCAGMFSVGELQLQKDDFGVRFDRILPPSVLTHDLRISLVLHNFYERVVESEAHAEGIRDLALDILANNGYYQDGATHPSVGVHLSYLPVTWSAGCWMDAHTP